MNNNINDEIINDLLGYPGLKIIQRPDIFNFSLDSTLLAYFLTIKYNDKKIIDLGCGNGFIPIFLTLRTKAHIYGVEIQEEIADIAVRSVKLNNLENQITIINSDAREIYKELGVSQFDVVTCNPPYFQYKETSLVKKNQAEVIARHEIMFDLDSVLLSANRLLKDGGTFAMVHRVERLLDIIETFRKHKIEPKRIQFVYPKKGSSALVLLIEGKKSTKKSNLKILPPLYVKQKNDKYTKAILKIFNYKEENNDRKF